MTTRYTAYAESLGTDTTTSSTLQDKVTVNFTQDGVSVYFMIASAALNEGSVSSDYAYAEISVQNGIPGPIYNQVFAKDTTDFYSCFMAWPITDLATNSVTLKYANDYVPL